MSIQERTIVTEAEEEVKRNKKKVLGIFPRRDKGSRPGSGATTPNTADRTSHERPSSSFDTYDDDDLPPREENSSNLSPSAAMSKESLASVAVEEDDDVKGISRTAGFDFKAISRALGKDIDVNVSKETSVRPIETAINVVPRERAGSAPPIEVKVEPPSEERAERSAMVRSASYAVPAKNGDGNSGMVGGTPAPVTTQQLSFDNAPTWERIPAPPRSTSPASTSLKPPSFVGFNAWSSPSTPSFPPRAAPPARPHPPEYMANPFANGTTGSGILGGWEKTEKEMAEKNPW